MASAGPPHRRLRLRGARSGRDWETMEWRPRDLDHPASSAAPSPAAVDDGAARRRGDEG
ncbi:hypothetical protein [Oryza sativa Japonica Group]|uniref:Uncharacterized protein n=1 Tax=Oryza sativa subsp. japonica TaxID=39947 RepID=Q8S0L1_ORYSJ|nr:hypothetical protein [Oryza sativa Japonica Group]